MISASLPLSTSVAVRLAIPLGFCKRFRNPHRRARFTWFQIYVSRRALIVDSEELQGGVGGSGWSLILAVEKVVMAGYDRSQVEIVPNLKVSDISCSVILISCVIVTLAMKVDCEMGHGFLQVGHQGNVGCHFLDAIMNCQNVLKVIDAGK